MKKTFTLILAAAGVAMAATEIDLTDKWEGDTADISGISGYNGQWSVALTLDLSYLTANSTNFFTITGTDADSTVTSTPTHGYGYYYDDFYEEGEYNLLFNNNLQTALGSIALNGEKYITLVMNYSYLETEVSGTSVYTNSFTLDMYRWDAQGNLIDADPIQKSTTRKGYALGTLTTITKNSQYVKDLELYYGNLTNTEETAYRLKNAIFAGNSTPGTDSTVPEPATATLSLLALAGLAARRRRK